MPGKTLKNLKETEEKNKMFKTKNGITLIALVVTIVILLILAGVSISLIIDNNGIIKRSKDARSKYGQARENEQADLDKVSAWIDNQVNGNSGGSGNLPTTEETKPYLPSGFTRDEDTNLDNGLVIKDSVGNEYVWVEVPRKTEVYETAGLKITEFSAEEITLIKTDLKNYTKDYREPGAEDTWCSECGIADSDTYTDKYSKMLKSVYQNGGFWIGRYEIGIDENTVRSFGSDYSAEHSTEGQTPVIKKNKIPYNWIRCDQAESLAETFAPSGYITSLMFGLQWDLVCKHLETKGTNPGTSANSLLIAIKGNSTDWGNYFNASFDITNTDAMYSIDRGVNWKKVSDEENKVFTKTTGSVLLTTGADARNSMLNIYDLAGNVWEWTLEKTLHNDRATDRGGDYSGDGSVFQAYYRYYLQFEAQLPIVGARVTLY